MKFYIGNVKSMLIALILGLAFTSCDIINDIIEDVGDDVKPTNKPNIKRGLVIHYNFDNENASDISGNRCDGVCINSPKFTTETKTGKGKALVLNGFKKECLSIPYNPTADSTSFSMSFWLKDFTPGNIVVAANEYGSPAALTFTAMEKERQFKFLTSPNSSGECVFTNYDYSAIQSDKWAHIVVTFDGVETNDVRLYVNGTLVDKSVSYSSYGSTAIKFLIGDNTGGIVNFKFDNYRLYSRCLMPEEVKIIYNEESK